MNNVGNTNPKGECLVVEQWREGAETFYRIEYANGVRGVLSWLDLEPETASEHE